MPPKSSNNVSTASSSNKRKQLKPKKKPPATIFYVKSKEHRVPTTTMNSIKYLQKSTKLLIPKLPFARVVREILYARSADVNQMQQLALAALQESCELYLTHLFEDANMLAMHANRITLSADDMDLALQLRDRKS
ncbi:uncharacterized protein [Onthophagus taurus]|uniref:uncharacterized protein n=1 Tax=Onthophagus taurus TaxID=166361 RepID=UPI000C20E37D|nr:histone H3.3-like [Onthophagus taurus]